ncbi:MAG: hypothetical protein DRG78_01345 [Epsilonproteobacteria bacterium]|nr:MAG: hypothetical protein DRG78_01345 [Campylobacterota bacterium]
MLGYNNNMKNKINKLPIYILLCLMIFPNIVLAQSVNLTQEEKEFIKKSTIKVGVEQWNPIVFLNDKKEIDGICGDFVKLIIKRTGLKVDIVGGEWDQLLDDFKNKKLDILPDVYSTEKRKKFGLFSDPYFKIKDALHLKDTNNNIHSLKDLEGKRLAIQKGNGNIDKIQEKFPKIKLVFTKDLDNSINYVLNNKVDAFYAGQIYVYTKINNELIKGLKSVQITSFKAPSIHLFSKLNEPLLASVLQKGLKSITSQERSDILRKWIYVKNIKKNNNIKFSEKEILYLKNKKVISMCIDPNWMPFEKFDENGKHVGMTADYFKIFSNTLQVDIKPIQTKTWDETIQFAKSRKCDILSLAMETPKRKEYFDFTTPYLKIALVIATKLDVPFINDIKSISGKKVCISKGYAFVEILKTKYPNINIVEVENIIEGLDKVSKGELFGYVGTLASIGHKFQTQFNGELKIAGKFDENWELGIGVRNDDKVLFDILQKVVNSLETKQQQKILNDWISIKYEKGIDYSLVWQILIIMFIIILFFIYRQNIIRNQKRIFETLFNDAPDGLSIMKDNKFIDCNKAILKMLKFDIKEDMLDMHPSKLSPKFQPDGQLSFDKANKMIQITIDAGSNNFEWVHLKTNGDEFWVDITLTTMVLNNEDIIYIVWKDISEKKELEKDLIKKEEQLFKAEKMASMGEMIGNIAHQWRQPLSVISTASTGVIMQKKLNIFDESKLINTCTIINDNAQYLSKTIDDFKNFIKGDRIKKIFSLKDNINSFLHLIDGSIKSHDINVILDLSDDIKIDGYENELIQCFINIFNNAKDILEEMEDEDNRLIFIYTFKEENKVIIKIKDNAGGISQDIISKVFEPYFTTKHKSQGTGLGLHMTYNLIVDGMGGIIEVNNVSYEYDGKNYVGAEFTITLPLN